MNGQNNEYLDLVYDDIIHITALAYLIKFDDQIVSVPRSISELTIQSKIIAVPEWFMIQEELEGYVDESM